MSPGIRLVAAASSLILPNGLPAAAGPGLRSERLTLCCRPPPEFVEAGTDTLWGEIKEEVTATGRRRGTFARQGVRARPPNNPQLLPKTKRKKNAAPDIPEAALGER